VEEIIIALLNTDTTLLRQNAALQAQLQQLAFQQAITTAVNQTHLDLIDVQTTLDTMSATIAANQATLTSQLDDIETAIALVQQAGVAVTLPEPPPAGYGGASADDSAAAVWAYPFPVFGSTAFSMFEQEYFLFVRESSWGFARDPQAPLFYIQSNVDNFFTGTYTDFPSPQTTAILSTDNRLSWLLREAPTYSWAYGATNDEQILAPSTTDSQFVWQLIMSEGEFDVIKRSVAPASPAAVPPVWPGLAGVVLGTAVALSDGLVVTGPLAGLIVVITSVSPPVGYYPFGTIRSYVRAGAVVFTTDNDDSEFPQPFGPDHEVLLPRSMQIAASATIRLTTGITGTVQPFTIA
jgi:hypothetical protein